MAITEEIRVRIRAITTGFKKSVEGTTKNIHGFNRVMGGSLQQFKDMTTESGKLNKRFKFMDTPLARMAHTTRRLTHGLRGFRMEMLGVMFFGMGLQKFFTGLLRPAMELTGLFELWAITLQILFLPIAMLLLEFLMPIMMRIIELDESTKIWIGTLVILGAILGAALFLIGMFALGLGSIIQAFGVLAPIATAVLGGISLAFGIIVAAVIVFIVGIFLAWKDNFGKIREWMDVWIEGLKNLFGGLWDIISGPFKLVFHTLKGEFGKAMEDIKNMIVALFIKIPVGIAQFIVATLSMAGLAILRAFQAIYNTVVSWFNKIPGVDIPTWGGRVEPLPSLTEAPGYVGPSKGGIYGGAGGGGDTYITQNNDINVADREAWTRDIDERLIKITEELAVR